MNRSEKKKVNKSVAKEEKQIARQVVKKVVAASGSKKTKQQKATVRKVAKGATKNYMKGVDPERVAMPGRRFHGPASQIASVIMLPGAYAGRLPVMNSEPSAAVPLKVTDDMPGNTTGVTLGSPDLPASELCALKFKDTALRSLILWWGKTSAVPVYAARWNVNGAITATSLQTLTVNQEVYMDPLYLTYVSGDKVHGTNLYLGKASDGKRYYLASGSKDQTTGNATLIPNFTAVPANQQLLVRLYRTNGDRPIVVAETTVATGGTSTTFNVAITGGYAISVILQPAGGTPSNANLVCGLTLTYNGCSAPGASCWGQTALAGLEAKMSQIDEYSIHGSDLTITQAASVTNENGRVLQVALCAQTPIESTMTKTFADLGKTNSRRYVARNLKKGCDGFCMPGGISDFDFQADFDTDVNGNLINASYVWVPPEPYIQFSLYVPTSAGQVFSYTSGTAVEYLTADPWTQLGSRRLGKNAVLNSVIETLGSVPQFYDNEDHESDILKMLGPLIVPGIVGALLL